MASENETNAASADNSADEKRMTDGRKSSRGTSAASTKNNDCLLIARYLYSW